MATYLITYRAARTEMVSEGPTDSELQAARSHLAYLSQLHAKGALAFAGRTQDNNANTIGIAVISAEDEQSAQELLSHDPGVLAGVFTATVQPYAFAIGGEKMFK